MAFVSVSTRRHQEVIAVKRHNEILLDSARG